MSMAEPTLTFLMRTSPLRYTKYSTDPKSWADRVNADAVGFISRGLATPVDGSVGEKFLGPYRQCKSPLHSLSAHRICMK
jgi:hypothetical protein